MDKQAIWSENIYLISLFKVNLLNEYITKKMKPDTTAPEEDCDNSGKNLFGYFIIITYLFILIQFDYMFH